MKKKNNGIVVFLLILIIVILGGLCFLFATDRITFNNNSNQNNLNDKSNSGNQSQNDENKSSYVINYKEETYTTKNKEGIENTNNKRNIITIENKNDTNAASLIENKLNEISNKMWEDIKSTANDSYENSSTGLGVSYLIETGEIKNNRLTFIVNTVGSFGGIPWDNNEGYNFDAVTGNLLKLDDLGTGVFDYIYSQSISQIEKESTESTCLEGDWKDRAKTELNKDGNWYFTKDGIKVIFPKYSIACGAEGSIIIDISKNDINPYLNAQYKIK